MHALYAADEPQSPPRRSGSPPAFPLAPLPHLPASSDCRLADRAAECLVPPNGPRIKAPYLQGGVTAHRRGHQEAVALGEDALHVVDINVRVADDNVVPLTGLDDPRHPLEHLGMLILPRVSELLGEVALADEDGADAGHLLQNLR